MRKRVFLKYILVVFLFLLLQIVVVQVFGWVVDLQVVLLIGVIVLLLLDSLVWIVDEEGWFWFSILFVGVYQFWVFFVGYEMIEQFIYYKGVFIQFFFVMLQDVQELLEIVVVIEEYVKQEEILVIEYFIGAVIEENLQGIFV